VAKNTHAGIRLTPLANRRSALSIAIATVLAVPSLGLAQEAPPAGEPLEEIVVSGIRASIESAIATKQESMSIVEVISAEDIGKLPDTSIAESISRLPGLTSQRAEGRASAISLRGTDPAPWQRLNGREQVSITYPASSSTTIRIDRSVLITRRRTRACRPRTCGHDRSADRAPLDYSNSAVVLNSR
jgi:outer membrane receptor protein involved in Fe transport